MLATLSELDILIPTRHLNKPYSVVDKPKRFTHTDEKRKLEILLGDEHRLVNPAQRKTKA